jgi:hypothetical protein
MNLSSVGMIGTMQKYREARVGATLRSKKREMKSPMTG